MKVSCKSVENWLRYWLKRSVLVETWHCCPSFHRLEKLTILREGFVQIRRELTEILTKTCCFNWNMGLLSLICGGSWWFVMFRGGLWCFGMVCGGLWWFMVVCDVLWWFVMVCGVSWWFVMFHGGSWCFVMVRGGFFSTILKKISCDPLFNQSQSKIQYQISFWMRLRDGSWCFVMVRGGSWWFVLVRDGSWWFVVVRGGSWWFVVVCDVFFSRERSCDPLFNQSESQIHYQLSFWMRLCDGSWWFIRDGFVVVRDGSWCFIL